MKRTMLQVVAMFAAILVYLLDPLYRALTDHFRRSGFILGANEFSKEERVAFESVLEGFEDALVMSSNVNIYTGLSDAEMERSGDTVWRPMPYIAQSYDGQDQTANFRDSTQLAVPARIGYEKSSPWVMSATELRDALQSDRLGAAAREKLASDINVSVSNLAALQGTLVVKRTVAATGFDDVAQCEAIMNEIGVQQSDRIAAFSTRDYNGMAGNLAARQTVNEPVSKAYREAYVGRIASFETFKLDYSRRLAAAAGGGGLTVNTLVAGANYYTPLAKRVATTGEQSNVDNRYQTVTVSATTNVAAGDCFTIAGVNSCHLITKQDTGQLKTFRVISVDSGTTMTISPPIISAQGGTDAELAYQNCVVTPSATAAIVFLNTTAAAANPFWQKGAIEIMPGRYSVDTNSGLAVMRARTSQGIELTMSKQTQIGTLKTLFRLDARWGVTMLQPEMAGIELFGQA